MIRQGGKTDQIILRGVIGLRLANSALIVDANVVTDALTCFAVRDNGRIHAHSNSNRRSAQAAK